MSDAPFPPLPDLAFDAAVPGSAVFARYREPSGMVRTVERRPETCPSTVDALIANDLTGVVARVRAVHTVAGDRFLVYDDAFACALPARIHDRQWSPRERLAALAALARGLEALHARGVTHGDLTPDAVLMLDDGTLRFAALARIATASPSMTASPSDARTFGPTLNRVRATGGALTYLAPEQFMANTTLPESDVFAWGCIAYEVTTGRAPFGFVTDPGRLLEAMTRGPQRPLHELTSSFSQALDAAVRSALAVDRKQRALPSDLPPSWCTGDTPPRTVPPSTTSTSTSRVPVGAIVMLAVAAAIAFVAFAR